MVCRIMTEKKKKTDSIKETEDIPVSLWIKKEHIECPSLEPSTKGTPKCVNRTQQKMACHVENNFRSSLSLSAHTLPEDLLMPVCPSQSHYPTLIAQEEVGNILSVSEEQPRSSSSKPGNRKSLSTSLPVRG